MIFPVMLDKYKWIEGFARFYHKYCLFCKMCRGGQGPIIIDFIKIASEKRFYAKAFVVKLQIAQYLSTK